MAQTRKQGSGGSRARSGRGSSAPQGAPRRREPEYQNESRGTEIILLILGALVLFLFLCNFGICGSFGNLLRYFMFGLFGLPAYITPPLILFAALYGYARDFDTRSTLKTIAGTGVYVATGMICEIFSGHIGQMEKYSLPELYRLCGSGRSGGGIIAGSLAYGCRTTLGGVGTGLLLAALLIVCAVVLTDRSFIRGMKKGGRIVADSTSRTMRDMRERGRDRRQRNEERRQRLEEERRLQLEMKEDEKLLRRDRKGSGVTLNTRLEREDGDEEYEEESRDDLFVPDGRRVRDDVHEITIHRYDNAETLPAPVRAEEEPEDPMKVRGNVREILPEEGDELPPVSVPGPVKEEREEEPYQAPAASAGPKKPKGSFFDDEDEDAEEVPEPVVKKPAARAAKKPADPMQASVPGAKAVKDKTNKPYEFPPIDLLKAGKPVSADSERHLKDTAARLEEALSTYGVNARVVAVSRGPAVTRFELQPEAGTKVSKFLNLTDDIKMYLAATDIRIEAPIPGKSAVGIEVPNKVTEAVMLRDVVDSPAFRNFKSNMAFGAGKDLTGAPVVADLAAMPHVLIAGATGSGKSVCINTIIMSILYKASPEDVRLIMIDPKVVELSVYNGIPHLLIPVVTDPQQAAGALNWAVAEMTRRYKLFADTGVRDLEGYREHIGRMKEAERLEAGLFKMPQILVIVDELADLMMTCGKDVEAAIVRLTQLARAAGIHLVIATQRPSVDVITGLIKANMPSRIAFAVSSNTDSRTILDMPGAERLLGKGDMLFFPKGYNRPARVQGAYVSDDEVTRVVSFIRAQEYHVSGSESSADIAKAMESSVVAAGGAGEDGGGDRDAFFVDAARMVIGKEKASIGMLQRVFKVGFNRAARIMDQLCEAGVVSEEEGTKPRRVLMTQSEFDAFLESDE
ncbi:MAG: DNA translocase FtsK [Lachnospiraceae bacterium]|nr:DNA translocase FtsK [Lachnospiraceae bacterium]